MPLVTVPVSDVVAITPRSRLVTIDLRNKPLDFIAGQAVLVGAHGQHERRPYSIACSPERLSETGKMELLIALEPTGGLSANLAPATPGMLVDIEGPMGDFTFPEPPSHNWILFVAGGTGIAPLRGMIDHALRRYPNQRISVLYSARRGDEFAFIDELRRYAEDGKIELHQTVTRDESTNWGGGRGRIGRTHFDAVIHEPAATLCFVCGPTPFVQESAATLKTLGVPDAQIRTEQWGR